MYSEKITLRLTETDKEIYQIEADKNKLPLTTYLRNKISGVNDENKEFEPQLIYIDYRGYQTANHQTNLKINTIGAILNEAKKFTKIPNKTSNEFMLFLNNPVGYVTDKLYEEHSKSISFKISKHKLLELMEINLNPLKTASDIYNKYTGNIKIDDDGNIKNGVNIESYSHYTKNEADNNRLQLANDIISVYERANAFNSSITVGNIKQTFNPIINYGINNNSESILIPCLNWVLGKR